MAEQPPPQQQFDTKVWPVVYPAYIDAAKTIALVRRCAPRVPRCPLPAAAAAAAAAALPVAQPLPARARTVAGGRTAQ
jgi:hypothetical protein